MNKNKIGFALLCCFIIAIFFFNFIIFIIGLLFPSQSGWPRFYAESHYIISCISLGCIATLIWLNIKQLELFHLDQASLILLVIFGSLNVVKPRIPFRLVYLAILLAICVVIGIILWRNRSRIPATRFLISRKEVYFSGLVLILIVAVEAFQPTLYSRVDSPSYNPFLELFKQIVYNLSSISATEEILFRGFFWGYLIQLGWSENRTLWAQAIIFWLLHFTKIIDAPLTFFVTIPITTMMFSLLLRNTKQVFWSVVFHTLSNAIIPVILTL